jgi:hypothetical protein
MKSIDRENAALGSGGRGILTADFTDVMDGRRANWTNLFPIHAIREIRGQMLSSPKSTSE